MSQKLSIIIPAFNEERTIHSILTSIRNVELVSDIRKEIIIVDDCSNDKTLESIRDYQSSHPNFPIQIFNHDKNKGKGAAIHTGISKATGDYVIIQDADLEYDPQEFNILLKPILMGVADVVYGSRLLVESLIVCFFSYIP